MAFCFTIKEPLYWLKKLFIPLFPIAFQHMTSLCDFIQLCSINEILLIEHFFIILQFFDSCDIVCDFFRSRWAFFLWFNLIVYYWVESIISYLKAPLFTRSWLVFINIYKLLIINIKAGIFILIYRKILKNIFLVEVLI